MPGVRFAARLAVLLAGLIHALPGAAMAEPDRTGRHLLGQGWLLSNDAIGDGHDRWRSVGLSYGAVTGPGWTGRLPDRVGEILEYRLTAEAIAPSNLVDPDPADRRYAGIVSAGLHGHFALGRAEVRLGGDLVAVGPRTGVAGLHEAAHDLFGLSPIRPGVHRLDNALHPTLSAEIGRSWPLGPARRCGPSPNSGLATRIWRGSAPTSRWASPTRARCGCATRSPVSGMPAFGGRRGRASTRPLAATSRPWWKAPGCRRTARRCRGTGAHGCAPASATAPAAPTGSSA